MDWKAMTDKVKQVFQQRGGAPAAKEDAQELRDISQEQGSATDKAKDAAAAIREPGAHNPDAQPQTAVDPQQQPQTAVDPQQQSQTAGDPQQQS